MRYDANGALLETQIPGLKPVHRGKVRDIYDMGDSLLFVATDRISAFDCVMPNGIPDKGRVLTAMSLFWFDLFSWAPNHVLCSDASKFPEPLRAVERDLAGRSLLVKKAKTIPLECIVRGYITGSGWKSYQKDGTVCGQKLRPGYRQAEKLDEAIFTPSTKADEGHDENISFETACKLVGTEKATRVKELALRLYNEAAVYAEQHGIILADTKFEFGECDGECADVGRPGEELHGGAFFLPPIGERFHLVEGVVGGAFYGGFQRVYARVQLVEGALDVDCFQHAGGDGRGEDDEGDDEAFHLASSSGKVTVMLSPA